METVMAGTGDDPRGLLADARGLARRVRRDQRATWFALLVFAGLTFASIPAVRYGGHHLDCRVVLGGRNCRVYSEAEYAYWPVALVLAYVLIAAFYVRRTRARGVGTRVWPYAIAGVAIAAALAGMAFWELHHPAASMTLLGRPSAVPDRLASPAAAIGLALLVLAWAERSRAVLLLAFGYLAAVLADITFAGTRSGIQADSASWYALPAFFQGCVLLAAGIGFALGQRSSRERAQ